MSTDFPYLVVSAAGAQLAQCARPELALTLCEMLGDGSVIRAGYQVLWRQGAEVEPDAEAFAAAVKSVAGQLKKAHQAAGLDAMMSASAGMGLYDAELEGIPKRARRQLS